MHRQPDYPPLRGQFDAFGPRDIVRLFGMAWLFLLHCWVHIVAFGVNRSVIFPCVVIAIFTVTRLRAAHALSFLFLSGGFILRCVLFVTIVFLKRVHHVDVI